MTGIKSKLLNQEIKSLDITGCDLTNLVDGMRSTAFQARNLARAADIYVQMLADKECSIILCLAGSLVSAGLKKIILTLIENKMVDVIVSTGANIVDQDFFEALGFKHYQGFAPFNDIKLQELKIDRIYDTLIDEDNLRICDNTICKIANSLPPNIYSSREFIIEMGRYLQKNDKKVESIVQHAFENLSYEFLRKEVKLSSVERSV